MIDVHGLTKTFGNGVHAVNGVDFSVAPGEIVGFLGANGAGKTTTMRMLTTLLTPTSGTAAIAGHDLLSDPRGVRRSIGYVSQSGGINPVNPLGDELELQAMLYGMRRREARARITETLETLRLTGMENLPGGALSGGQRRRFDIAFSLLHRPPVLFLDEPTTGLDPQSRAELWEHIRSLGLTVFLSTHYLEEAEALCDRLLVIDSGRIAAQGTPAEIKGERTLTEAFMEIAS
ncbi:MULTISPECIES: ABC transporter ATP-binding protein [unclassified Nonomuraea]|uniref:ABC transporter ATP-binding protein n=1 Tax=Nonomuraea sp. NPDC003804 TaxID=3154547 RepID=UPI00339EAEDF